jgi:glycosyltransferase involved in cell wall biosynthesis
MVVSNDVVHDSRVLNEAHALMRAGHEVTFIGWDRTGRGPETIQHEGIPIRLVQTKGVMRAFAMDLFRNPLWWRRARRLARDIPYDAIHCHDLDTMPIGVRLKRATDKPLVYDCHEVFGYMIELDVPPFVVEYTFRMERRLSPLADRIITVNEAVKEYVDRVSGKDALVVRNCHELFIDEYRPAPGPPFTILYVGTLHVSRFILQAIDVVGSMPEVRLILGGSKKMTPVVQARCAEHPNTRFVGVVPNEQVLPMTLDSHLELAMLDPQYRINRVALSNKMFEAMVAGRPSVNTKGLISGDVVERERCGLAIPYTKEAFRAVVEQIRDDPALAEGLGRNGLAAAKREYNWGLEQKKLVALYEGLGSRG